jgi:hypothetical protein
LKKILKIIFFTLLFIALATATFFYLIFTSDNSEYSTTSPSGKYEFTIYESCFFYCEQSAKIYRIEDDITEYTHLSIRSETPIFYDDVTFNWSKDERKVHWYTSGNSGTVDILKDSKNN